LILKNIQFEVLIPNRILCVFDIIRFVTQSVMNQNGVRIGLWKSVFLCQTTRT
jgi:hypothetical protein